MCLELFFLRRVVDIKLEMVPTVAYSCFVIHNFCERNKNCDIDEEELQAQLEKHKKAKEQSPNNPDPVYSYTNPEGAVVRNIIKEYLAETLHEI